MKYKLTKQRQQIYDCIQQSAGHMSADQIYTVLKEKGMTIGIATIYRNLNILFNQRLINRIRHPEIGYIYDKNTAEHYHFRCIRCNRVMDVNLEYQSVLNQNVEDELDAEVVSHSIIFDGICRSCRNKDS